MALAEVYLDFQGKRHAIQQPFTWTPYETKVLSINQLLLSLGIDPAQAPEGGITIIQAGAHPALIANGKITDPATGFSSTIDFPLPQLERASALHASGIPVGMPSKDSPFAGAGDFVPHVVVRNLLGTAQTVTITVEYPQPAPVVAMSSSPETAGEDTGATGLSSSPKNAYIIPRPPVPGDKDHHPEWGAGTGATVGSMVVTSLPVAPYSTADYSLAAVMSQLPLPLPFCSIRIQYSGAPGSLEAEVSSVESKSDLVVDARVENEGNGWAGSGANPWHLDKNAESILFLTNMSDQPARIGFSITANGIHYYLTRLKLNPHETRAINIRALRDAQLADFKKNKIPAAANDGSVDWIRIDNVPVMGRLMVITRHQGMADSYDCNTCMCPLVFDGNVQVDPGNTYLLPTWYGYLSCYGEYEDCNYNRQWSLVTSGATWSSGDAAVATVDGSDPGRIKGVSGGNTIISAAYSDCGAYYPPLGGGQYCTCNQITYSNPSSGGYVTVQVPTSLKLLSTTSQGPASCSTGYGGWERYVIWQVLDQTGNPINQTMSVSDSVKIGSPNTCGASAVTGTATTNGSGQFSDHYSLCSSGCVGGGCQTDASQTYTVAGITLKETISIVYTCTSITLNGQ